MSYKITISENNEYVIVKHEGNLSIGELEEARDNIKNVLLKKGLKKVFVDVSEVTSVLRRIEQFCFIGSHNYVFPENVRISVVVPEKLYEYDKYIEEVSKPLKINQKIFIDKEEAIEWLTQET